MINMNLLLSCRFKNKIEPEKGPCLDDRRSG